MRRAWLALGGLALACGSSNPEVELAVSASGGLELSSFVRLHVLVRGCDEKALAYSGDFLAGESTDEPITVAIRPGLLFYAWVQGWEACDEACILPKHLAVPGDCVCFEESARIKQKMTSEGCTGWTFHDSGALTLNVAVGPIIAGACPPPISACIGP
ncbi:MAG: hypothetical protein HYV07_27150 [Deltaproteobacteria bacterium]|nr:hypothetical protein [Deltaproteobacteria bacterium]